MSKEKPSAPRPTKVSRPGETASASVSVNSTIVEGPDGLRATRATGSLHFGPLPSPAALREYQEISPAIVTEIIGAFAEQGKNRRSNERWVYVGGVVRSLVGLISGLAIALFALYIAWDLAEKGHEGVAGVIAVFDIAAIVGVFVYGTIYRNRKADAEEGDE